MGRTGGDAERGAASRVRAAGPKLAAAGTRGAPGRSLETRKEALRGQPWKGSGEGKGREGAEPRGGAFGRERHGQRVGRRRRAQARRRRPPIHGGRALLGPAAPRRARRLTSGPVTSTATENGDPGGGHVKAVAGWPPIANASAVPAGAEHRPSSGAVAPAAGHTTSGHETARGPAEAQGAAERARGRGEAGAAVSPPLVRPAWLVSGRPATGGVSPSQPQQGALPGGSPPPRVPRGRPLTVDRDGRGRVGAQRVAAEAIDRRRHHERNAGARARELRRGRAAH
jgi:hypothetical protein